MLLAEEGDEPDLPSTEKKSEDVTDGYVSDSSQSTGSVDDDFGPFARSQTPVFGQSMNPAMHGLPAQAYSFLARTGEKEMGRKSRTAFLISFNPTNTDA